MATLYSTDGTTREVLPKDGKRISLEEAWGLVGGYVERVMMPRGNGRSPGVLLVDEEGLLKQLPLNLAASQLAGQLVCGPALHTKGEGWG
jgi:hypothetical protein